MTTLRAGTKIFVGGISNDIFESDLIRYFEKFSKIEDCVIMVDKKTSHSRGFGFITVEDFYKADSILKSQPHIIKGKRIECKLAIPKDMINETQQPEETFKKKPLKDISFYYRKLFVGGLPMLMKESDMLKYFQRFGEVEKCIIKKDEITGKSRGKWIEIKIATPKDKIFASLGSSMRDMSLQQQNQTAMNMQNDNVNLNESYSSQTISYLNRSLSNSNENDIENGSESETSYCNESESNTYHKGNYNAYASVPNSWSSPSNNQNQPNLFQYENYIPKKQIAFFNRLYNNTPTSTQGTTNQKTKSNNHSNTNTNTTTTNTQSISNSKVFQPMSTLGQTQTQTQKIDNKQLHPLFANSQIGKEEEKYKPILKLNVNLNLKGNSSSSTYNNTTSSSHINLFGLNTNDNTMDSTFAKVSNNHHSSSSNSNSNTNTNSNSNSNNSNTNHSNSSTSNNNSNNVNNIFSNNNMNHHHNFNHNHNQHTNSDPNTNNNKENSKFTHYFNNCITHPYFNSYYHYKLFDSNGEEVSKLVYKNSDKVTLFVDERRRLQDFIINTDNISSNNNNNNQTTVEQISQAELELIIQEQSRIETMTENEGNNQGIIINEVILSNDSRDIIEPNGESQPNGDNRQQEPGFFTDKEKNPDITSYKPY